MLTPALWSAREVPVHVALQRWLKKLSVQVCLLYRCVTLFLYPLGDPATSKEDQWKLRYHRVKVAIEALATPIEEQTVFDV